jgi:hypothetical protein
MLLIAGCTWLALGSQAFADVQITIHDGRVSISAKDATVRQILTEWARVGRTQIVNVERIAGAPMTIELTNVSEQEALDLLMRSLSGYLVAPRSAIVSDASQFDKIIVLPAAAAPRPPVSASPTAAPAPFAQLNGLGGDQDDESNRPGSPALPPALAPIFNNGPQANPNGPQPNPRRPFNTQPVVPNGPFGGVQGEPPSPQPQAPPPPGPQPAANPIGAVSTPGMIAPAPTQPGQVMPPGLQPRRSPND